MMKKFVWLLMLVLPSVVFSEPHLALREGLKCSSCHFNRTGGGKRTKMGTGYATQSLPWKPIDLQGKNIPHYWSMLNDLVSIGGDFRFLNQSTFVEDNAANTFQTDKANLYFLMKLIPNRLSFYADESIAPGGAQSREIFGILELPAQGWLKAGKFILPYGIRIEDDRALIREVTGFNFSNPDLGVEMGFEPGNWSMAASVTNGTAGSLDNNTSKQIVGSVVYVRDLFRIGASGSYNSAQTGKKSSAALWGGFRFRSAVFLGEIDFVRDELDRTHIRDRIVTHAEMNYWITEGWNVKVGYEFLDPDTGVDENERDRVVLGVEPFLIPFLQLGVYYRFNQSIPQNIPQNADELSFRVHLYF